MEYLNKALEKILKKILQGILKIPEKLYGKFSESISGEYFEWILKKKSVNKLLEAFFKSKETFLEKIMEILKEYIYKHFCKNL